MDPFQKFVSESAKVFQRGKKLSLGLKSKVRPANFDRADALIFSPHPDDECIAGALPLRLAREAGWKVGNVAVTLGSRQNRRTARLAELKRACAGLGFGLIVAGLENINLESRKKKPAPWRAAVRTIAKILTAQKPRVIFLPHESDGHPAHIGTHFLVLDALEKMPGNFKCFVVETEFWGQMKTPNLLVESSVHDVGRLVAALACHAGEMRRNPYHARLPAWMMDNVRRAEMAGGPGGAAPDFTFGTLYRRRQWSRGRLAEIQRDIKFLSCARSAASLFR